ncbi:hypothetical protein [Phenylobacterium sp.]|uniref:terminase small subunit-like protein n=1 Tax=Phenylobacterium sp. TaxID=1871053 RepID=UPI002C60A9B8|nr:hypothetical protein [Phenylobacterium sp.]HVI31131.1 hypothetical protein [Phenylobacterium sp.]
MPFAYPNRHGLQTELLQRVASGETMASVCAAPHMPSYVAFRLWALADPAFAEALRTARLQGAWRRRYLFYEARAQAVLVRVRAGGKLHEVLSAPDMPSRRVFAYWRATQPHIAEELHRLHQDRRAEHSHRNHPRFRRFDPALADRILVRVGRGAGLERTLAADPELPCRAVVRRWRTENPDFEQELKVALAVGHRHARLRARCTPELIETVAHRIRQGASLANLGLRRDMPCRATLYAWMRTCPEFGDAVEQACHAREQELSERMVEIAMACTPQTAGRAGRRVAAIRRRLGRLSRIPGQPKRDRGVRE